jgi:hypothetical protein
MVGKRVQFDVEDQASKSALPLESKSIETSLALCR